VAVIDQQPAPITMMLLCQQWMFRTAEIVNFRMGEIAVPIRSKLAAK
jgi:hypothetical protein